MRNLSIVIALTLIFGCGTQQNLSVSYKLNQGMSKDEVHSIMGAPVKSDFYKNVEEWHYCKTGMNSDQFLALFFHEGELIAKKNYSVTLNDTRGVTGSCENFIKRGSYREPDTVIEIRSIY